MAVNRLKNRLHCMAENRIKNELNADYHLAGIATSLKDYKICFHLNNLLDCDFKKLESQVFEPKDRTHASQFSVFKAVTGDANTSYMIFGNKNMGGHLLPEVKQFDYILQINGKFDDDDMKRLIEGIRQFPEVMMCAEIQPKKIKSRERLVYQEEKENTRRVKGIQRP
jgi:hypothetical protein